MLHEFKYAAPHSRQELLETLAGNPGRAKLLAGGTDLLVNIRAGVAKPDLLVDSKKVEGYSGVSWSEDEGLVIRPAVTVNEALQDRTVRDRYPLIASCGHDLASYQIRNRATVIGNVVNASPCSDLAPALLCLGARAELASAKGSRSVPFVDFFTGVKRTVLAGDEVLERIVVPASSAGVKGEYRKLKRVAGHDLGIVGVALALVGGELRIAVSSAAPTPVLVAGLSDTASEEEAVDATLRAIKPISDVRCSAEYRVFMVGVFVRRLLKEVRS